MYTTVHKIAHLINKSPPLCVCVANVERAYVLSSILLVIYRRRWSWNTACLSISLVCFPLWHINIPFMTAELTPHRSADFLCNCLTLRAGKTNGPFIYCQFAHACSQLRFRSEKTEQVWTCLMTSEIFLKPFCIIQVGFSLRLSKNSKEQNSTLKKFLLFRMRSKSLIFLHHLWGHSFHLLCIIAESLHGAEYLLWESMN